jgi:hypothetical protein
MVLPLNNRKVLELKGSDSRKFLQNLVSNDVYSLNDKLVYSALLTPQGKYIADFFIVPLKDAIGIDVHVGVAQTLLEKLKMYKLRSDVEIKQGDLSVALGLAKAPTGALSDPRHPKMGWRLYRRDAAKFNETVDWTKLRIDYMIPEYGSELTGESYILEMGFERLHGVDFKKGCYVGQEVTARMKHKTELKKGLVRVQSDQNIFFGDELFLNEKSVGSVLTSHQTKALAYVRIKNKSDILSTKNSEKVVIDRDPISSC